MKGIRFYLEHDSPAHKRKGEHNGNVFAAFVENGVYFSGKTPAYEGLGALTDEPNSPVCGTSASLEYLWKNCKCISEAKARKIHPRLFERLDND